MSTLRETVRVTAVWLLLVATAVALVIPGRASQQSAEAVPQRFTLAAPAGTRAVFLAGTFNGWSTTAHPMTDGDGDGVWETTLELTPGRHLYKFVVDGRWLADPANPATEPDGQNGVNSVLVVGGDASRVGTLARKPRATPANAVTPEWAKRVVWYQIFPERFRNGDTRNDPPGTVAWTMDWYGRAPGEKGDFYTYVFDRRYGGDLQGVARELDYLQSLGVSAIYFNPIFEAPSLHKYDTEDYRHVDDNFGVKGDIARLRGETDDPKTWQWTASDRMFLDLVGECHRRGMRVVLDGVFNHTGSTHWAFRDVLAKGKASRYADWYKITSWGPPVTYQGWWNVDTLPEIARTSETLNPGFASHVFAITRRWMDPNGDGDPSDGIDGWRLDVAPLVPRGFWVEWRKLVKSINPDAYISAEIWEVAPEWLDGETFDAQMNYPLAASIVRFFVDTSPRATPTQFGRELDDLLAAYPRSVVYAQQNLLDSHDTDRILSMLANPNRKYNDRNRPQNADGKGYDTSKPGAAAFDRLKLITTFQMTFVGAPMIWYGDEVGMWGPSDPSDRKPMLWPDLGPYANRDDRVSRELLEHYRRLIAIRNTYQSLQTGDYRQLVADDGTGVFAFERRSGDERVLVIVNTGASDRTVEAPVDVPDGAVFRDALNAARVRYVDVHDPLVAHRNGIRIDAAPLATVRGGRLAVRVKAGGGAVFVSR